MEHSRNFKIALQLAPRRGDEAFSPCFSPDPEEEEPARPGRWYLPPAGGRTRTTQGRRVVGGSGSWCWGRKRKYLQRGMAAAVSALGGLGDVGDGVRPRRGAGGRAAGLSSCRWLSRVVSGLLGLGGRGAAQRGGGGGGAEARRAAAEVPRAPLEAGTSRAGYTRAAGVTGGSSGGTAVSNPAPVG